MKISIVVPSYNQSEYLEDCLVSIIDQPVDFELIVMDGGSTDQSIEVIRKYQDKIHFWQSKPDGGQGAAIKEGFRKSSGEILFWLNSDDRLIPQSLGHVIEFFERHKAIQWAYGNAHKINSDGKLISRRFVPSVTSCELSSGQVFLPQESTFFRRDFYFSVGEIDPYYGFALDFDLWFRMSKQSKPGKIKSFVGEFRVQPNQKSRDVKSYANEVKLSLMNHSTKDLSATIKFLYQIKRKAFVFGLRFFDNPIRFLILERPRECLAVIFGQKVLGQSKVLALFNLFLYLLPLFIIAKLV